MKRQLFSLALILSLLAGCGGNAEPTPEVEEPSPTPVAAEDAPLWASLTTADLPTTEGDLMTFFAQSAPAICLLGSVDGADISLYGLNPGYGGGLLLREGEDLFHLEGSFTARPELWWSDFDGDGSEELAACWPLSEAEESGTLAYDLTFYRRNGAGWTSCSVSRDTCAQLVLDQIQTGWDAASSTFTLTYAGQTVRRTFPDGTAPGRLTLGRMCNFYQEGGKVYLILDAWSDVLSSSLAIFRAEVVYSGDSFQLQDLRMDFYSGV